jgi:hypothetical protein
MTARSFITTGAIAAASPSGTALPQTISSERSSITRLSVRNRLHALALEKIAVIADSTITCAGCGTAKTETMPTDACQYFYECTGCGRLLRPKPGDCCVFCSYGSVPCPPIQAGETPTCRPILTGKSRAWRRMI